MSLLSTLSEALGAVDNRVAAFRRGGGFLGSYANNGGMLPPLMVPTTQRGPHELSGLNRVVSYADSVATYPTIFAVWSKLLRHLSTTDIGVYEMDGQRRQTRVFDTDLEQLLREPAPGKGLLDLLQWIFNPYLVEGNSLVAKYRADGPGAPPTNLIPLDWRFMTAFARQGGPVERWISHQAGTETQIDPGEVLHFAWHSPDGSSIGPSPLGALGVSVRLDDAAQRYQIKSFDNAARPSGALVVPADATLKDDEKQEMKEAIAQQHQGIDNAFRVAVLYGGMEWKPMSFSAVEAELINTRKASRDDVCIAYDVRKSVIAEPEGAAARSLPEILRDFHRSLRPHVSLAEHVLKRQLIDAEPAWAEKNYVVKFDLSDLLRGTYAEEVATAVDAYVNGLASEDEGRQRLGLPPRDTPESSVPRVPYAQLQPGQDGQPRGRDGRTLPHSQVDKSAGTA